MSERLSREVRSIRAQADIVARASGRTTNSVHYLVAMFVVECKARDLLVETRVDDQVVLDTYERMPSRDEPAEALAEIHRQSARLTETAGLPETTSMVLLASLLRVRECLACRVLERAGANVPGLRSRVIGLVNFDQDRGHTGQFALPKMPADPRRPAPTQPLSTVRPTQPAILAVATPRISEPRNGAPQPQAELRTAPLPVAESKPAQVAAPRAATPQARPAVAQPQLPLPTPVFQIKPTEFPTLCEVGRNLTEAALQGRIDPVIGRDAIIEQVIDILLMRHANNPCLIGEAGVGKTAVAQGLAARLAGNTAQYGKLGTAAVVEITVSSLLAGTGLRGAFSERMGKLRDEVAKADGQVIVFMDEVHTMMGAGTGDGPLDAANDLKSALARGQFPLIGATTKAEYKRHIEADPAMDRRFQVVEVPEPTVPETLLILAGVAPTFGRHHNVSYAHDALVSAVHLAKRFVTDRCLPDKAIAVLDRAGAQAKRNGRPQVLVDDVARAVHTLTGVPMDRLLADERGRIRDLGADLQGRILGHREAMERIARRIQRNYAGFSGDRPVACLLFAGAAGVGKTETAKALAELLFVSPDALVRFDMSDYAEAHAVSKLLGSPPGYVGHQQAGLLSVAMQKRPYRVLLFDEIDRAAPEIQNVLVQLVDNGRIQDAKGHLVDVRNSILVFTTNAAADVVASPRRRSIGFGALDAAPLSAPDTDDAAVAALEAAVADRVQTALAPELWRRLDETIVFRPLDAQAARAVVRREIGQSAQRLYEARLIRYDVDDRVVDLVLEGGLDPALGARPLRSRIERVVEAFVTDHILDGVLRPGADATLTVREGRMALQQTATAAAAVAS
ncbi:MAG: ATP-dependent Clp protease ATP-binding subunit [Deltaproteobacteria bacterium]|nr:ATP-dependent Clp protease ATP-binding subunit [Deltaproteobacteria bacterium]